ncbi:MAG: hypothetical protein ABI461_06690 [Polyangiaceae bacterium]
MKNQSRLATKSAIVVALSLCSTIAFAQEKQADSELAPLPSAPATTTAPRSKPVAAPAIEQNDAPPARDGITYITPLHASTYSEPQAAQPVAADTDTRTPPLGDAKHDTRESFWKIGMGIRAGRIDDPGFNSFANNSQLWQYSLAASRTLFASHRFSFAAGAAWDVGQRDDSQTRGLEAGIVVHRLTIPLEARFHAATWLYGFARVAPGADYRKAWVNDPSASTGELDSSAWAFATDFSLGASFLMGPHGKPQSHSPRFWLTPEFGYAYATSTDLSLAPKGAAGDPQQIGTTDIGALALRGPFVRASIELSF